MRTESFKGILLSILLLTSLLTPLIVLISPTSPVSADYQPTDHLVVSEVSPTKSPGEWVEIYNPTNQDISLNGCWVDGYSRDYYFSPSDVIKAHGYFLAPGVWLSDCGVHSYAILKGPGGTIDGVGWGSGTIWKEGDNAPCPGYDHSLVRKSGPTHEEGMGNGYDTNNNANDFFVCDSPNPQGSSSPHEPPFVLVSISPDENGSLPETDATFTVAVKNDRLFEDNFDLDASGFWGWDSVLDNSWLSIGAGETENTTLRVTIPALAGPGMNDTITVTATSRIMEDTNSDSCIVTAYGLLGVEVSISPSSQSGMPQVDRSYSVEVRNWGITTDNYTLTVSDELGWGLSLDNNQFTIDPKGDSDVTTLWVSIPENTLGGVEDIITVTATSQTDNTVSDSDTCTHVCVYEPIKYSLLPTDDATVDQRYYDDPQGASGTLCVGQHYSTDELERSFLKFDLSQLPPEIVYIEDMILKLYHHFGVYDGDPPITVELREVENDDWCEADITWDDQPAMGDLLCSEVIHDYMDGMWFNHPDNGVDVRSYIENERADNYASFGLISPDAEGKHSDVEFSSKETTYENYQKPYLEVWYYPCSPPPVDVDVRIDRGPQTGLLGERLDYPVTVTNLGTGDDNFDLTVSDTEGWGPELSEDLLIGVPSDESRTVTLSVTIPMDAEPSKIDSITVTATSQENEIVSDNAEAIAAAPGVWVPVSDSLTIKGYGVGVVGAGENIYIINSDTYQNRYFMCYNTAADEWKYLVSPPDNIKNAVAMAWDGGNYIYVLNGASYGTDAFFFYRYDIGGNSWARLQDTPHTQGAGDAMCWVPGSALGVGDDNYLYAIVGKAGSGSEFYRYSVKNSSWSPELNLPWSSTDDGCSLVWTGGSYLYALRGEWEETSACYDFARYDLINNTWTSMAPIPADPHDGGVGGVGDGGSLLWIGGVYDDYIYALSGNQAYPEPIWDNRFYRYTILANSWERLADLPAGVGYRNGPRLGFASGSTGKIYAWRGCKGDPVLWMYCPMGSVGRGIGVVLEGFNSAYNVDHGGLAPWVWYENTPENAPNPPVMVAKEVGDGTVTAAGIAASCEGSDWQGYTPDNLDVLLDETFEWMAPHVAEVNQILSNPSFEQPGSEGATPSDWPLVYLEDETSPATVHYETHTAGHQYGPNSGIVPDEDWACQVYYTGSTGCVLQGIAGEQTSSTFGTVDQTNSWSIEYYVEEDYYPSPTHHEWAGAIVEVEFTSGENTCKLRYYHSGSAGPYDGEPADNATVKYIISENLISDGWVHSSHVLNDDIESKFGFTEFTVNAVRFGNLGKPKTGNYTSITTYWDGVVMFTEEAPPVMKVLWYGKEGGDNEENVYYDASRCSELIDNLENMRWAVDNTIDSAYTPITPSLLEPYDILVIPQLRLGSGSLGGDPGLLPDADVQAIKGFVEGGGALLIMERSDSGNNNYCRVQNKILDALDFGWWFQHDEVQDAESTPGENHEPWLDIIDYHPIGGAYEAATGNDKIQLYGACSLIPFVDVSISPDAQGGTGGETLTYMVTVRNNGTVSDNYSLENSDNAGWVLSLDDDFLAVPVGKNRTTTLTVTIPENAIGCTEDSITVTVTSQSDNTVSCSDSCTAHVIPSWSVEVSISPGNQENLPGGTLKYEVTVTNTGTVQDTYDLSASDTEGWGPILDNGSLSVPVSESRTTALTVAIPENAVGGTEDDITVTATSESYITVSDNGSCIAHAKVVVGVEVLISPENQENAPGGTLEYTVTVTNTGNIPDTYDLSVSDSEGWSLSLGLPLLENELLVSEDAYTMQDWPGNNYNKSWLDVGGYNGEIRTYLKFDLSGIPDTTRPKEAKLRLRVGPWSTTGSLVIEARKVANDTWTEGGLAWNNQPACGDFIDSEYVSAVEGQWAEWDVTSFIQEEFAGDKVASICLRPEPVPSGYIDFDAKEKGTTHAPRLILVSEVLPGVPAGENVEVPMRVFIPPENLILCADDIITVTATSLADNTVENSASCIAHASIVRGVDVSISPDYQENENGGTLTYTVTVTNTGNVTENYNLSKSDNAGWTLTLPPTVTGVTSYESREVTLTVEIPSEAENCTSDNITVTATSQADNTVENSASCIAHAGFTDNWTGTAGFSLVNLYTVNVDKTLDIYQGSKLVVKFYSWGDAYESENVIETFAPPVHVEGNENARHPGGTGVMKTRLVLTTDDTSNELLPTIENFTVCKLDLAIRFSEIPAEWLLAQTPEEKLALAIEFSEVPAYWLLAPD